MVSSFIINTVLLRSNLTLGKRRSLLRYLWAVLCYYLLRTCSFYSFVILFVCRNCNCSVQDKFSPGLSIWCRRVHCFCINRVKTRICLFIDLLFTSFDWFMKLNCDEIFFCRLFCGFGGALFVFTHRKLVDVQRTHKHTKVAKFLSKK